MPEKRSTILQSIDSPDELRRLSEPRLERLASELRNFLVESISSCGGHFAGGLGTVELAIALHYVFRTPYDRLIWDVGHQAYPHKILTGRRDLIHTIRQQRGLTPFLKTSESRYDAFGAGHSSTSISAAAGMAMAARAQQEQRSSIAVIGDGGMTAGMAYEALNHAGTMEDLDLLVILNDNKMSISPNVGALNNYLTRVLSSGLCKNAMDGGEQLLESRLPTAHKLAMHMKRQVRDLVAPPGAPFEELGFQYFGPIDGHDLPTLLATLKNLRTIRAPRLLHVVTCKGNGYERAEREPVKYHGVPAFDPEVGIQPAGAPKKPTYSKVFGKWLCDMAGRDRRLVAITPAMAEGSGMTEFARQHPSQYVDVGIAEQHSVTLAAGMAAGGAKPVVAIYSSFLQRAYDQVVHDVTIQKLPVLFAIDRAGLVGPDGPTHAGSYDVSFLRPLPGICLMAPADENECRQMLYTGFQLDGPAAVRYPRGAGPGIEVQEEMEALPVGKAKVLRSGHNIALLAFGSMVAPATAIADRLDATLVNMRFIKPLDGELVEQLAASHQCLITLEEGALPGGAGHAVYEHLAAHGLRTPIHHIGLPERFIDHGSREEMLSDAGLDAAGLERNIHEFLARDGITAATTGRVRPLRTGSVATGTGRLAAAPQGRLTE